MANTRKERCLLVGFRDWVIFFSRMFVMVMIVVVLLMLVFLLDTLLYIMVMRFMRVCTVHDVRGYKTMGDVREDADNDHTRYEESD